MKNIPRTISGLTKERSEILERVKFYNEYQNKLRNIVNTYEDTNDAPIEVRKQIYENKIILNHYQAKIKEINSKLKKCWLTT